MGNIDELISNVGLTLGRELTDEEKNQIKIWEKCRDLSHFVEGFQEEWKLMQEMLISSLHDVTSQWRELLLTAPSPELDIKIAHAKAYGACQAISSFIASVNNAPEFARQVPEILKSSIEIMRAAPPQENL